MHKTYGYAGSREAWRTPQSEGARGFAYSRYLPADRPPKTPHIRHNHKLRIRREARFLRGSQTTAFPVSDNRDSKSGEHPGRSSRHMWSSISFRCMRTWHGLLRHNTRLFLNTGISRALKESLYERNAITSEKRIKVSRADMFRAVFRLFVLLFQQNKRNTKSTKIARGGTTAWIRD